MAQLTNPNGRVETGPEHMKLISGASANFNNPDNQSVSTHNFLVRRTISGEDYAAVMRITNAGRVGIGYQLPYAPTSRLNVGMGAYKFSVDDTGKLPLAGHRGCRFHCRRRGLHRVQRRPKTRCLVLLRTRVA